MNPDECRLLRIFCFRSECVRTTHQVCSWNALFNKNDAATMTKK